MSLTSMEGSVARKSCMYFTAENVPTWAQSKFFFVSRATDRNRSPCLEKVELY